jgi:tetratricopeptide (TPR) repeat protein
MQAPSVILTSVWLAAHGFAQVAAQPATDLFGAAVPAVEPVAFVYPFDETLFPADLAPPTFRWSGGPADCRVWRITLTFPDDDDPVTAVVHQRQWSPDPLTWEVVKRRSSRGPGQAVVTALDLASPAQPGGQASLTFATSSYAVEAPIFYRDVNLPFVEAVKDPSDIRWRFGRVSSLDPPPVVMGNLPVCGNCHSFSADGQVLGMDVDYANSKGSYVITATSPAMALLPRDIITWDNFQPEDGELTFGLLSQVSPDGQWVVSTVKDKSVFVPRPDLAFSQLFFPIKGILASYHRATRAFAALPGADDPAFVQSNPAWSPDGRTLVFARAPAYDMSTTSGQGRVLLTPEECREFLKDGRPFRFDLYRIPFNDGRGGRAEPLVGASGDGRSNFFPKFSPDGRWIIFCKAANYMLLQPDSELFIIPAEGGPARRLRANLPRMNSWHSWSPNGRWLVFSSKAFSDYTQLFLTHIDEAGNSTPPVLLERFTAADRAANIPEFVNLPANAIVRIEERFLNDYSFERAGNEFYRGGEPDRAIEQYLKALELNPENVTAHQRLGFLLYHVKYQFEDGLAHTREALRLDPDNGFAHSDLGMALLNQNQSEAARAHLQSALDSLPPSLESRYQPPAVHYALAQACLRLGRLSDAASHLREAVHLQPDYAEAHYLLALVSVLQGQVDEALRHHARAVALKPAVDTSAALHERLVELHAQAGRTQEAMAAAEHALGLAQRAGNQDAMRRIQARLDSLGVDR